jgi:formate-nitrite transporter family protein
LPTAPAAAFAADMMKKRPPQKAHRSEPAEAGESFSPSGKLDNLSRKQKREIDAQSRPNAALIHETIRAEGESELERTWWALGLSGLAAGLSIGFSMVLQGELHAIIPEGAVAKTVVPFGYTAGFVIVVLGRQQLFTENTLTPILPLLHNRDLPTLRKVLTLWLIVLAANVCGAFVFAAAIVHTHAFDAAVTAAFAADARHLIEDAFGLTVVRAVFAGWLIALMVWLLPTAQSSSLLVIILITYIIGLCGFPHIVAGTVDAAFLLQIGEASVRDFFLGFFVPTLIGNIIGGVALVAVLNFGQVAPEIRSSA